MSEIRKKMKGIPVRRFDYTRTAEKLLTPAIVQMLSTLHEHKGRQDLFFEAHSDEVNYRRPEGRQLVTARQYRRHQTSCLLFLQFPHLSCRGGALHRNGVDCTP